MKRGVVIAVVVLALLGLGGAGYWYMNRENTSSGSFRLAAVSRGDLLQTITASGTLQAEEVIDIGSQVTGQIASFGLDKEGKQVDYRSEVKAGEIIATIDPSVYKSEAAVAQAGVDEAKASVTSAKADLVQLKAKLYQAQRDWDRAQKLGPSDALAESSYDSYKAAFEMAQANVGVGESAIVSANARVAAAQASLEKAQRNLDYCVINSPVDGMIIDRRVNIGQTVVSSLSASSLFLLAKDLRRMQIWASVNEADVGSIRPDQPVTFTADAVPNRTFQGKVAKLRYNATMTNNVVTYTVEINVDNSDLSLIPYATTNVAFEVAKREGVLMVPNAALRYTPSSTRSDPAAIASAPGNPTNASATAPATKPSKGTGKHRKEGGPNKHASVWVVNGLYAREIKVERGITDGVNTEIKTDHLKEGDQIITGELTGDQTASGTVNPFALKMPSGGGRGMRQ